MKLRILGTGGTGHGYRVWIDGHEARDVVALSLEMSVHEINRATITYLVDDLDTDTEVEVRTPALSVEEMIPDPRITPTVGVRLAFQALGIGETAGYVAIKNGTFPVEVLRMGGSLRVPTAALRSALHLNAHP